MTESYRIIQEQNDEITALTAQVASLVKDIGLADTFLSRGDKSGALIQIRQMYMRSTNSYLDCIGREAVAAKNASEVQSITGGT